MTEIDKVKTDFNTFKQDIHSMGRTYQILLRKRPKEGYLLDMNWFLNKLNIAVSDVEHGIQIIEERMKEECKKNGKR